MYNKIKRELYATDCECFEIKFYTADRLPTLGARGFSCAVSGVGHSSIVTRAKNLWSRARFFWERRANDKPV